MTHHAPAPARARAPQLTFADLGVPAPLVAVLTAQGITTAFPIQAVTVPDALAGRDVLGRGRTGSGKTIAFAVPTVAALTADGRRSSRPNRPRALVLVPTRELADQVAGTLTPLAQAAGASVATVYGGVSQRAQVAALRRGVDVVVACPGRLEDLVGQGHLHLGAIEVTVLDEADHMADLGFLPAVKRILDTTPRDAQRLLFSATLDRGVDVLVRRYLTDPVVHEVEPEPAAQATMVHHVLAVRQDDKAEVVRELASGQERTLLFLRTKHRAKRLAQQLTAAGVPAVDLHGNLTQSARQRNLAAFGSGQVRVLVATDIAARGIHVDDVRLVVHVDPPAEHKAFTHRSGRTARAGSDGVVVTLMTPDQHADVRALTRRAGITARQAAVVSGDALLRDLAGPPAPRARRAPAAPAAASPRPIGGQGRSSRSASSVARPASAGGPLVTRSRRRRARRPATPVNGTSARSV
ncbi:MAG: DEAD/DEAH box helicase [Angustibacter sp.]